MKYDKRKMGSLERSWYFVKTVYLLLCIIDMSDSSCDDDWLFYQTSCYRLFTQKLNHARAESECQKASGHLASITSPEENNFVKQLIYPSKAWIGLSRTAGMYKWTDGSSYDFVDWFPSEPTGSKDFCVEIKSSQSDGLYDGWYNRGCSSKRKFICEKAAAQCDEIQFNGKIACRPEGSRFSGTVCACPPGQEITSGSPVSESAPYLTRCQKDLTWSTPPSTCSDFQCEEVTFDHGDIDCGERKYQDVCDFKCPTGTVPYPPGSTMTCELDKTWSGSMPTECKSVDCGSYPPFSNGKPIVITQNTEDDAGIICEELDFKQQPGEMKCVPKDFGYPSICSFYCFVGYTLRGPPILKCGPDGTWDNYMPTCKDITCEGLLLENGRVICPEKTNYASTCEFKCDYPRKLIGAKETTCLATEKWSHPTPKCSYFDEKCPSVNAIVPCDEDCDENYECSEGKICCPNRCGTVCIPKPKKSKKTKKGIDKTTLLLLLATMGNRQRPVPPRRSPPPRRIPLQPQCPLCSAPACSVSRCPGNLNALCRPGCGCRGIFYNSKYPAYDISLHYCQCPVNMPPDPSCGAHMCNGIKCLTSPEAQCGVSCCGGCFFYFYNIVGSRVPCKQTATCQPGINSQLTQTCDRGCIGASCPRYPDAHCQACLGCQPQFYDAKTFQLIQNCY